jgi:hypothetical protein
MLVKYAMVSQIDMRLSFSSFFILRFSGSKIPLGFYGSRSDNLLSIKKLINPLHCIILFRQSLPEFRFFDPMFFWIKKPLMRAESYDSIQ